LVISTTLPVIGRGAHAAEGGGLTVAPSLAASPVGVIIDPPEPLAPPVFEPPVPVFPPVVFPPAVLPPVVLADPEAPFELASESEDAGVSEVPQAAMIGRNASARLSARLM
jgi:hypothetical protein